MDIGIEGTGGNMSPIFIRSSVMCPITAYSVAVCACESAV